MPAILVQKQAIAEEYPSQTKWRGRFLPFLTQYATGLGQVPGSSDPCCTTDTFFVFFNSTRIGAGMTRARQALFPSDQEAYIIW